MKKNGEVYIKISNNMNDVMIYDMTFKNDKSLCELSQKVLTNTIDKFNKNNKSLFVF